MTVFSVLWGPFETHNNNEVSVVVRTDIGDLELYFDNFNKYYDFMRSLPWEMKNSA